MLDHFGALLGHPRAILGLSLTTYWLLVAGCLLLEIGDWPLVARTPLASIGCCLLAACCWRLEAGFPGGWHPAGTELAPCWQSAGALLVPDWPS
jgi:hypothetical protein